MGGGKIWYRNQFTTGCWTESLSPRSALHSLPYELLCKTTHSMAAQFILVSKRGRGWWKLQWFVTYLGSMTPNTCCPRALDSISNWPLERSPWISNEHFQFDIVKAEPQTPKRLLINPGSPVSYPFPYVCKWKCMYTYVTYMNSQTI